MSPRLLFTIVFIEGYCSLGAEVIALRRLVPHMGSAIVVTAPTIGFFLLALAVGYYAGSKIEENFVRQVKRNFLVAALLCGLGLSAPGVDGLFNSALPVGLAYLLFIAGVLCPVAYLLGQTVPILTNLTALSRVGEASGRALFWSTLGSFLGAASLSVGVMQWLGVFAAVLLTTALLCLGSALLGGQDKRSWAVSLLVLAASVAVARPNPAGETAYADYRVEPLPIPGEAPMGFWVNNSLASATDRGQPATRYIQHIRRLMDELFAERSADVLVLGAGGFTLSQGEARHRYVYVDIDPAIRRVAEQEFLKRPAQGEFIVDDARHFAATTARRFDLLVVDVYSNKMSIPGHLVTTEFWQTTQRVLKPAGVMVANLILDGRLASPYARNLLASLQRVYGPCEVAVLHRARPVSNVVVSCYAPHQKAPGVYRDEQSSVDWDAARMN